MHRPTFRILALPWLVLLGASAALALPDPGPIPIPPQPLTVKIRPALVGHHPRLFFDSAGLAALKAKIADPRMAEMKRGFLAKADELVAHPLPAEDPLTEDPTRPYGDGMFALSFAYLITEDAKYLDAARGWAKSLSSYSTWAGDEDLGAGHCAFGLALAYDWLYERWTPEERKTIEGSLTRHTRLLMHRSAVPPESNKFWGSAYFQNHNWINNTGACAAALALYDTAPAEMQGYVDHVRNSMEVTYRHLGVDGGNHEGPGYAFYGTDWLLRYFDLLKGVDGEDLYDMPYMKGMGRYFVYNVMPDARSLVNYGDCLPQHWGVLDARVLYKLAAQYHDGHVEWLRQHDEAAWTALEASKQRPRGYFGSPFCLIWCDPALQPKAPDDLPLTGVFSDLGLVICRDRWSEDASVTTLICGPPGGLHLMRIYPSLPHGYVSFGHTHPDANSFLFWTGGRYTVGNPAGYTHDKQTHNENVWTIGDQGQRGTSEWFNANSYVGDVPQAHLLRVIDTPTADYVVGEAAPAYENAAGVREFRRHLLFVKGTHPYVVVYDQLAAARPSSFTSYLHAYDAFKMDGANRFTLGETPYAFGTMLGPAAYKLQPTPLEVLSHPKKQIKQEGFQLAATTDAPTASTWLITVVGGVDAPVKLGTGSAPAVTVGGDTVVFQEGDGVVLNGKPLTGKSLVD